MNFFIKPLVFACGSIVVSAVSAIAGDYNQHTNSSSTYQPKTYVREYVVTTPQPVEHVPLGDYCLYEPGDTYGLSYSNGCDYDGGYGEPETVIINRSSSRGSVYVGGASINQSVSGGGYSFNH